MANTTVVALPVLRAGESGGCAEKEVSAFWYRRRRDEKEKGKEKEKKRL
jgi:hypothetical protein